MERKNEKWPLSYSWILLGLMFIFIAILIDVSYYENQGIYGWYFFEDFTEFNFAGLFWFFGITTIAIFFLSRIINFKK